MNIAIFTLFIAISVFYLINIVGLECLIGHSERVRSLPIITLIYIGFSFLLIHSTISDQSPLYRSIALIGTYITLYLSLRRINSKISRSGTVYIIITFLSLDSIVQSLSTILISAFFRLSLYQTFIIRYSSSLIFNIIALIVINKLYYNHDTSPYRIATGIVPKKIYVLIAIVLFCYSLLLENQIVDPEHDNELFRIKSNLIFVVINISFVTAIIIYLLIYTISNKYLEYNSHLLENQIRQQIIHYEKIYEMSSRLASFRHDYKNHMICINSFISDNDIEKLKEYVQELSDNYSSDEVKIISGNKVADAVLTAKYEEAAKSDISFSYEGIISEKITPVDTCIIFSNALDNAIEACEKVTPKEKRYIRIKCAVLNNVQIIHIENSVANDINIEDNMIKTSKNDKEFHGFGLTNIRRALKHYNADITMTCEDNKFVLEIGFSTITS